MGMLVGDTVFVKMDMRVGMMMFLAVGMALMSRTSEKTADLMGGKIWYNLHPFLELIRDSLEIVCLHYGKHHLFVDSERHIYLRAFHHGRPVLVSDGMSQFHTPADDGLMVFVGERVKVNHKHRAELYAEHNGFARFRIVIDNVAVGNLCVPPQCDGVFRPACSLCQEPALLCRPLVEEYIVYFRIFEFGFPFGITVHVAEHFGIYFHNLEFN